MQMNRLQLKMQWFHLQMERFQVRMVAISEGCWHGRSVVGIFGSLCDNQVLARLRQAFCAFPASSGAGRCRSHHFAALSLVQGLSKTTLSSRPASSVAD